MQLAAAKPIGLVTVLALAGVLNTPLACAVASDATHVVGEITNMTVGTFKNGICDLGFQCKVTLPTVLRGSQLQVETVSGAQRWTAAPIM